MWRLLGLWTVLCCALCAPTHASIRINEFVAKPFAGENEWIELVNTGSTPVSLDGWWIADATAKQRTLPSNLTLEPGAFLILASKPDSLRAFAALDDSIRVVRPDGWPILNDNDAASGVPADVITLGPPGGAASDSVAYFASWLAPEPGRSVERVDAALPGWDAGAWGWSEDPRGFTPGRRNSLAGLDSGTGPPAEWDGPRMVDPGQSTSVFTYRLPAPGTLAVWLLEPDGREVAVLRAPGPVPASGRWAWSADAPRPPHEGQYLVCMRWQTEGEAPRSRCRSVWVRR